MEAVILPESVVYFGAMPMSILFYRFRHRGLDYYIEFGIMYENLFFFLENQWNVDPILQD